MLVLILMFLILKVHKIILVTSVNTHTEGVSNTVFSSNWSHIEGVSNYANASTSHTEGGGNINTALYGHVEGSGNKTSGDYSHAEGTGTISSGIASHSEGSTTQATGIASHSEGSNTQATGTTAHAEGVSCHAYNYASHAEGQASVANAANSHAEGYVTTTSLAANNSHSEGRQSVTYVYSEHASANSAFHINGDAQYTRFVRNVVVSDTGIGTKTHIETYPLSPGKLVTFGNLGAMWVGTAGMMTGDNSYGSAYFPINISRTNTFQNIAGSLCDYTGGTISTSVLLIAYTDSVFRYLINLYVQDDGLGNAYFYTQLYDNNTNANDITGSANLTMVFETLSVATS